MSTSCAPRDSAIKMPSARGTVKIHSEGIGCCTKFESIRLSYRIRMPTLAVKPPVAMTTAFALNFFGCPFDLANTPVTEPTGESRIFKASVSSFIWTPSLRAALTKVRMKFAPERSVPSFVENTQFSGNCDETIHLPMNT